MRRSYRCLICGMIFVVLTVVKMVSPVMASDLKAVMIPVLEHNDDYHVLVKQVGRMVLPHPVPAGQLDLPESPLERIQAVLEASGENPMSDLPKASKMPEVKTEETETNPALQFGYQARDAFLRMQAEITDSAPPDNVSYEVEPLPFSETSPVDGSASSGFGYRIHPILNELRFHYGTDFAADEGTEISAFADGTVLAAGEDEGYGNYVMLDHGDGFATLYGHCSELLVSEGDKVSEGTCIAQVGSTGQSTGPHLHFELMHNGVYLNPEFYLYA